MEANHEVVQNSGIILPPQIKHLTIYGYLTCSSLLYLEKKAKHIDMESHVL